MMVVSRHAERRWAVISSLGVAATSGATPGVARSRLAHPSVEPPELVVLVVEGAGDVAWLHAHARRAVRSWVPVVAVVDEPRLAHAARAAGARAVVMGDDDEVAFADALQRAVEEATAPAVVIHLDAVRSA